MPIKFKSEAVTLKLQSNKEIKLRKDSKKTPKVFIEDCKREFLLLDGWGQLKMAYVCQHLTRLCLIFYLIVIFLNELYIPWFFYHLLISILNDCLHSHPGLWAPSIHTLNKEISPYFNRKQLIWYIKTVTHLRHHPSPPQNQFSTPQTGKHSLYIYLKMIRLLWLPVAKATNGPFPDLHNLKRPSAVWKFVGDQGEHRWLWMLKIRRPWEYTEAYRNLLNGNMRALTTTRVKWRRKQCGCQGGWLRGKRAWHSRPILPEYFENNFPLLISNGILLLQNPPGDLPARSELSCQWLRATVMLSVHISCSFHVSGEQRFVTLLNFQCSIAEKHL